MGGAWTWHQDYGYWYQNGMLYPYLVSVFIAVDPATRENGCLQVLEGSHLLRPRGPRADRRSGRCRPGTRGGDREAAAARARRDGAGDALFFHPTCCTGPIRIGRSIRAGR